MLMPLLVETSDFLLDWVYPVGAILLSLTTIVAAVIAALRTKVH